jgi:hypothetical protein
LALLPALVPGAAEAQEVRVYVAREWSDNALLGDPFGIGASVLFSPTGRVGFRVGYEVLDQESLGTGIPCAGLVEPGTCEVPEPIREVSGVHAIVAGFPVTLLIRDWFRLYFANALRVARIEGDTRGLTSDRHLNARESMWGLNAGLEAQAAPLTGRPLRLHLAATGGFLWAIRNELVADGYQPFDPGILFTRLELGASYTHIP